MGFTEMVDDGNAGDDAILRCLAILNSCNFSGASGHARRLLGDLPATQIFVEDG
jgi:hypothetical protein